QSARLPSDCSDSHTRDAGTSRSTGKRYTCGAVVNRVWSAGSSRCQVVTVASLPYPQVTSEFAQIRRGVVTGKQTGAIVCAMTATPTPTTPIYDDPNRDYGDKVVAVEPGGVEFI